MTEDQKSLLLRAATYLTVDGAVEEKPALDKAARLIRKIANGGLLAQHHTDSKTLREYAQQRDALRNSLQGAANYIDTLGGVSKSYRIALAQHQGDSNG